MRSKGSDIIDYLNEIESTKTKVNNAESLFTSGLNKLDKYKKWMKVGEVDRVQSEFQKFKIKSNNSTDYLSLILIFAGVMSALSSLESTLSGRKYKEEEEERAEQRRVAAIASAEEEDVDKTTKMIDVGEILIQVLQVPIAEVRLVDLVEEVVQVVERQMIGN
jgi:hypothetical protein